jgi:ribokinase
MSVDVVCAGHVFLDLTFEGLDELPQPGAERFARELHESPGGAAITAVGLARLGLGAAVAAPLGRDLAGRTLHRLLEGAGVLCAGGETERTAVAVVVPRGDERSIITFEPPVRIELETVKRLRPRAVVTGVDELRLVPDGAAGYAVLGDPEADRLAGGVLPADLGRARALLANASEAERLTGTRDPEAAALALAEHVPTAVVSCGADGAVAAANGESFDAAPPRFEARDTTGAGDLLAAAYVWGDLGGLPLDERLRRAVVYAALSVRTATGAAGAATLDELERALAELDPAIVQSASAKERA